MIVTVFLCWLLIVLSFIIASWFVDAFLEVYDSKLRDKIKEYFKRFRGV